MNLHIHLHLIRLSKSPSLFPCWLCHFKGLFLPVWCEIHQSKIPLVMSLHLTSRRVSDTMYLMPLPTQHTCMPIIFPHVWFKSRWNKLTSRLCHWVGCYTTSWKLASLAFKNYEMSNCSKLSTVSIYTLQNNIKTMVLFCLFYLLKTVHFLSQTIWYYWLHGYKFYYWLLIIVSFWVKCLMLWCSTIRYKSDIFNLLCLGC